MKHSKFIGMAAAVFSRHFGCCRWPELYRLFDGHRTIFARREASTRPMTLTTAHGCLLVTLPHCSPHLLSPGFSLIVRATGCFAGSVACVRGVRGSLVAPR